MKTYTRENLHIDEETEKDLKVLFPDKPLGECYAIHYIISRINLCSFMYIPVKNKGDHYFYNCYMEHYNKIKDKLTNEIIEAICEYDAVGSDIINKGNKGYNLAKIFDYSSLDDQDAFFEYRENEPSGVLNVKDFVSAQYSKSVIPYLCTLNKKVMNEIEEVSYKYPPLKQYKSEEKEVNNVE